MEVGYIYIRKHESYDSYNACKLGKTLNIPDRESTYLTSEIQKGYFHSVFIIPKNKLNIIEKLLQYKFRDYHIKFNAGNEFYNNIIIELIEPIFKELNINYQKLNNEEIYNLTRKNRIKDNYKKLKNKIFNYIKTNKKQIIKIKKESLIPREDQNNIINKAIEHFKIFDKGMLILVCGIGKTLISLWISSQLNSNTILIGVPNTILVKQWYEKIKLIFNDSQTLLVLSGVEIDNIYSFLKNRKKLINMNKKHFIITTYSSSFKVYESVKKYNLNDINEKFKFDLKILDEVHHLTSIGDINNNSKKFIQILNIESKKQVSLTATVKCLELNKDNLDIISNDDEKYFGSIIDKKSLLFGIQNNIICDYFIQTIITNENDITFKNFNVNDKDKILFLSAFVSLKSIIENHSHHILIYSNNKENSIKIIQFIQLLKSSIYFKHSFIDDNNFYYSSYNSEMNLKHQKVILNRFEKSSYGIISCVYCLGEGWDFPLLDAVVFSENMSSKIRIVQSALRASRKNKLDLNKKSKIILPILNYNNLYESFQDTYNSDLKKIKEVIFQLSLEDENIEEKIKVYQFKMENKNNSNLNENIDSIKEEIGVYNEELTKKLKLATINRLSLNISFQNAKNIISNYNIKSKSEYFILCEKDFRLHKEPQIFYKDQFTNWFDYLNIKNNYYDIENCKLKVDYYLNLNPNLKNYYLDLIHLTKELCKLDVLFPPYDLWCEFYNTKELQDIIIIKNKKKQLGVLF